MKWPWKKQPKPKIQFKDPRRGYPPKSEPLKPVQKFELRAPAPEIFYGYDIFGTPIYGPHPAFVKQSWLVLLIEAIVELTPAVIVLGFVVLVIWEVS